MVTCEKYTKDMQSKWDDLVASSKCPHFFFKRRFMEYHADKFIDHSFVFFDEKKIPVAALPANFSDGVLYSHQGLTFGGLIMGQKITAAQTLAVFDALLQVSERSGIKQIVYKRIPDIYAHVPAQEDLYALFRCKARLIRCDLSSTINLQEGRHYTKGKKWSISKAKKAGVIMREIGSFAEYWDLLNTVLEKRHHVRAVHTLEEIQYLQSLFPDNIKIYGAYLQDSGELLGGALLFVNEKVVHTQYLANSDLGRECGALDFVLDQLIEKYAREACYFSFGISTEHGGTMINEGLLQQKESFGARATVHEFYEILIK